uniref:Uncharacterized protein n=1 Tax=Anguilla anguilla TaxID=7936 RepID=A0A0E9VZI8_ANGAN
MERQKNNLSGMCFLSYFSKI